MSSNDSPIGRKAFDLHNKANVFADKNQYDKALALIEEALKIAPTDTHKAVFLTAKGQFLLDFGQYVEAEKVARESVQLAPGAYLAWGHLGMIQMERKSYKQAATSFTEAARLKPDFVAYTLLAQAEMHFDKSSALLHAKKALEMNSEWEEAQEIYDQLKND